jgi:glutamate--cysteine ligase catalytic subunit
MGLLSVGTPLEWKDAHKYSDHVRKHGIEVAAHQGSS